ncbi:MBL fold metallo-hydrolase [Paenibacillus sp. CC-CFT747]|nr:MBL fold metallo-hydrolase [Paenibacillus sp. CC-CFT747]
MKIEAIGDKVWSLRAWLIIPVTVWITEDEEGLTLIDAGIPSMADGILKFIEQRGVPLKRILLTHGHSDHVGAIPKILAVHRVPVYVHPIEIPYMEGREPYPGRKKAVAFTAPGLVRPLETDGSRLLPVSGLQPYHTPGHSPGHTAFHIPGSGILLAGDMFWSRRGKLRKPLFTANMQQAMESSRLVDELMPTHLEVCHGKPVKNAAGQVEALRANVLPKEDSSHAANHRP